MHPILFKIGDFPVATYGLMIVVGIITGVWLASALARRRGISTEFIQDLSMWALLTGFVGARLTFIIIALLKGTEATIWELIFSRGGFVFQGGAFFAIIFCAWYIYRHRQPMFEVADIAAPALILAHAFGRIGCFFSGCCYGVTCNNPNDPHPLLENVAVHYPLLRDRLGRPDDMFNYAYFEQLQNHLIKPGMDPLPIVPVQLFEAAGNILICGFLVWVWRRRKFSGQVAALYLGLYACLRFGLEYLRGDLERGVWFGGALTTGQINSVVMLIGGLALWQVRRFKGFEPIPALKPAEPEPARAPKPRRKKR